MMRVCRQYKTDRLLPVCFILLFSENPFSFSLIMRSSEVSTPKLYSAAIGSIVQALVRVDTLGGGTLNQARRETPHERREGILAWATSEQIKV